MTEVEKEIRIDWSKNLAMKALDELFEVQVKEITLKNILVYPQQILKKFEICFKGDKKLN